ncbi:hypothetical protein SASPL_156195 [Salvia splendens]|uniref:FHA domain-containing protein n=1 Tax=Salvia splendens TaxID=180675 RepID=A0A8X8VX05_SALSN|nr:hypothetical protein SASPL_156195 [Salvia splendens]
MSGHSLSLSYAKANSLSPPISAAKTTSLGRASVNFNGYNCLPRNLKFTATELRNFVAVRASDSITEAATNASSTWLLQAVGDGDFRHIGYKIARPGTFQIDSLLLGAFLTSGYSSSCAYSVIVDKEVSGAHARIEKTEENLLITDLDSTNGTFINEKRLLPGIVSPASPGNLITFGDTNLAIFKVFKVKEEELSSEGEAEKVANTTASS